MCDGARESGRPTVTSVRLALVYLFFIGIRFYSTSVKYNANARGNFRYGLNHGTVDRVLRESLAKRVE